VNTGGCRLELGVQERAPCRPAKPTAQDPVDGQNLDKLLPPAASITRVARLWQREHTPKRYKAVIYARPDVLYTYLPSCGRRSTISRFVPVEKL
jgi:hypothetical protein